MKYVFIIFISILLVEKVNATVYTWTGEDGVIYMSNTSSPKNTKNVEIINSTKTKINANINTRVPTSIKQKILLDLEKRYPGKYTLQQILYKKSIEDYIKLQQIKKELQ